MTDRDDRRIVEVSYRESPANTPSIIWEAIVPSLLIAGGAYVLVKALTEPPFQLAQFLGATFGVVILMWRLYEWDESGRPVHYTEHTRHIEDPKPRERPFVTSSNAQRIKVGKWDFTEAEWRRLGTVLATGRVSRSALAELQNDDGESLFTNITAAYPGIVRELQRLGWVDQNNETTDIARHWYGGRGIPFRPTEEGVS